MPKRDFGAENEQVLAQLGKKELEYIELIETLPAEIRRCALAGDEASADDLERLLREARAALVQLRKSIQELEARIYSTRPRKPGR